MIVTTLTKKVVAAAAEQCSDNAVLASRVSRLCQDDASLHMSKDTGLGTDTLGVEPMPWILPIVVVGVLKIDGDVGQSQTKASTTIARWLVRAWRLSKVPRLHRNIMIAKTCAGGSLNELPSLVTSGREDCVAVIPFLVGTYLDPCRLGA